MTRTTIRSFIIVAALLIGCGDPNDSVASAREALVTKCAPTVPDPTLAPPAGNKLAFAYEATGVQIYVCSPTATATTWVFAFPEAVLTKHARMTVTHFAGPTWEALDLSTVVGTRVSGSSPDTTAIPWLLLSGSAHTGDGQMSGVTYIQRLNTTGGLAPAAASCDAGHLGAVVRVPYTADYYFYEAGRSARACAE